MQKLNIKIDCTHTDKFAFNSEKITKETINHEVFSEMVLHFEKNGITFIDTSDVILLYKNSRGKCSTICFTTKTLEFGCTRMIDEEDLTIFITALKSFGFVSENNVTVKFCEYYPFKCNCAYDFNTNKSVKITPSKRKYKNRSHYVTVRLS